jgi:phosphoglycerate dehydrogenase-like enzyme
MKKIVSFFGEKNDIFEKLNCQAAQYANKYGFEYKWIPMIPFSETAVIESLADADAGIIDVEPYGESVFSCLTEKTKLLVRFGVGYDKVDLESATRHGITIARTTGANTMAVAEMALSLIMACRRQLKYASKLVADGKWVKSVVNETVNATIGIMGFGAIGKALAGLLKGFNCRIITYDPHPNNDAIKSLGAEMVDLEPLFRISDAISIHVPYCKETHHIVNASLLDLMKSSAVIVNTSRGGIVDENALYVACRDKKIRGAGLDVFALEPLSTKSPLIGLDNLLLTPHLSSQTEESLWRIYAMAIDIAADFFGGKDSPHILNKI